MDRTIIMGLGNPDPTLLETYHNAGMMAVERLAGGADFKPYKGLFSYASKGDRTFVLPLVYMNDSGRAAKEALRVLKAATADLLVLHDDSDIPLGEYRRSHGGRAAGHKGIQSIIDHLKTEEFSRIRIGIREKDEAHRRKAGDFVLSPITAKNKKTLEEVFERIAADLSR